MYTLELPSVNLGQAFAAVLIILALIILATNGIGAISKWFSPFKRMREDNKNETDAVGAELEVYKTESARKAEEVHAILRKHQAHLEDHDRLLRKDLEHFEQMERTIEKIVNQSAACNQILLMCMDSMLELQEKEHPESSISQVRKDLKDYLIHAHK